MWFDVAIALCIFIAAMIAGLAAAQAIAARRFIRGSILMLFAAALLIFVLGIFALALSAGNLSSRASPPPPAARETRP